MCVYVYVKGVCVCIEEVLGVIAYWLRVQTLEPEGV